jgi:transposase
VPVLAQWMPMVVEPQSLQSLSAEELRELTTRLMTQLRHQSALLDKLTHKMRS